MTESAIGETSPSNGRVAAYAIGGFLVTEIVLIALAFLWVFIYSTTINTGGDEAYYQAYAQVASPVVAILGGLHVNGVARLLMDESTPDADSPRTADGVWWQVPADLDTSMWL